MALTPLNSRRGTSPWSWLIATLMLSIVWSSGLFAAPSSQETIMVLRVKGTGFDDAVKGIKSELGSEFRIKELFIDQLDSQKVLRVLADSAPTLAILLDNRAIALYWQYQQTFKDTSRIPPSISLMGVFLDCYPQLLLNAAVVSYEVPIVTSVIGLRSALNINIANVGVLHRSFLSTSMEKNASYCKRENIALSTIVLPEDPAKLRSALKEGLTRLYKKDKIDALWIPNDNIILTSDILLNVLIPAINLYKKPVIVGVGSLVKPELRFGTFAVIPDHIALGMQAAELVRDAQENGWHFQTKSAIPPLSVYKIVNLKQASEFCKVKKESLTTVDQILESSH